MLLRHVTKDEPPGALSLYPTVAIFLRVVCEEWGRHMNALKTVEGRGKTALPKSSRHRMRVVTSCCDSCVTTAVCSKTGNRG